MNEKDSIQALERQARNTNRLMDNLCLAWKGRTWEEAHMDTHLKITARHWKVLAPS